MCCEPCCGSGFCRRKRHQNPSILQSHCEKHVAEQAAHHRLNRNAAALGGLALERNAPDGAFSGALAAGEGFRSFNFERGCGGRVDCVVRHRELAAQVADRRVPVGDVRRASVPSLQRPPAEPPDHVARPKLALCSAASHMRASRAQFCALGNEPKVQMARELTTGKAQAVTPEDFNERVKRLLADKPDPRKAEPRTKGFKNSKPPTAD